MGQAWCLWCPTANVPDDPADAAALARLRRRAARRGGRAPSRAGWSDRWPSATGSGPAGRPAGACVERRPASGPRRSGGRRAAAPRAPGHRRRRSSAPTRWRSSARPCASRRRCCRRPGSRRWSATPTPRRMFPDDVYDLSPAAFADLGRVGARARPRLGRRQGARRAASSSLAAPNGGEAGGRCACRSPGGAGFARRSPKPTDDRLTPRPSGSKRCQPASVIERDSKKRQSAGQAKGATSAASTRHRCTTSPEGIERVE